MKIARVLVATALMATAGTATASATPAPCNYRFCLWENQNFTGTMFGHNNIGGGNWCADLWYDTRSGANYSTVDLTLSDKPCGQAGRSFFLKANSDRAAFPFAVRSHSHCDTCRR
ncbi:hypothetical protein GCM10022247_37610 [Allokutzneria multivorans]|uniref:Peptidase inhibitor family I36 n=1 Tax=Allokutzneria multivorans TaxID=1142134 RepID=A0ABP7SGZ4_9PSEU